MTQADRSPLKDKSLRLPGQFTAEQLEKLLDERIEEPGIMAVFLIVLAGLEWWRWYKQMPPQPVLFSIVAALGLAYATWRVLQTRPRIRALRLGIEGERAVGQFLERLRAQGYHVLHDVLVFRNRNHVNIVDHGQYPEERPWPTTPEPSPWLQLIERNWSDFSAPRPVPRG